MDTPRGIICQIQISTSIYSDFCSLLSTLLLSLRCYDVLKNKRGFFDKNKNRIISLILVIFISISFSIGFIFFDRMISKDNKSYRYDLRDRCSYWCWLEHIPSLICFSIYWTILIFNIIFACKTNKYLKNEYKKLLSNNEDIPDNRNNIKTPLNESSKENINSKDDTFEEGGEDKKYNYLIKEEKTRIEELNIMRRKCLIYPLVTISLWLLIATYRVIDDLLVQQYDSKDQEPEINKNNEINFFNKYPFIQFLVQFFLVIHTFLSSTRGIFYGLSFIVFEEKVFFNIFRKCFKIKDNNSEINEKKKKKEIIRSSNNSNSDFNDNKTNEDNDKKNDVDKSDTIEMNISDYGYNENN